VVLLVGERFPWKSLKIATGHPARANGSGSCGRWSGGGYPRAGELVGGSNVVTFGGIYSVCYPPVSTALEG